MNISPLAPKVPTYPAVGDRVGFIDGPSGFPADSPGTVVKVYSDRWYDHIADVLLDDGTTETIVGAYTTVGIGAYLLPPPKFPIGSIRAAVAARGDEWTHQAAPKPMFSNDRIAEVEDFYALVWCDYEIRKLGRTQSMQIRAFSGIDDNPLEVAA